MSDHVDYGARIMKNMDSALEIAERMAQTAPVDNPMPPRRAIPLGVMKKINRERLKKRRAELRQFRNNREEKANDK